MHDCPGEDDVEGRRVWEKAYLPFAWSYLLLYMILLFTIACVFSLSKCERISGTLDCLRGSQTRTSRRSGSFGLLVAAPNASGTNSSDVRHVDILQHIAPRSA